MRVTTRLDAAAGFRAHVISGAVTFDELQDALRALYQSADFDPRHHSLWDLRAADLTGLDAAQVRALTEFVRSHWGNRGKPRAALVVARDFEFGMARMYELRLDGAASGEVQVFRSMDEARAWLGVEPTSGPGG